MKTVLIIEGDGQDQEALQALLKDRGYKVTRANGRSLQVSEITQEELPCDRHPDTEEALATFRSDLNGKLYRVKQAENATFEVKAPPLGVEQHYRDFYDNAPIAIFRSSPAGKLLSINPAGARMHKYDSPQEMVETVNRTSIADALYPDADHRQEILAKILHSTDWHVCEQQFRCKDGSFIDGYFHIRAVRDVEGRVVELEGFVEDISERKRAERELKFTQFAIDKTVDQAFWIDESGRIVYANDAASYTLGYERQDFLSLSVFDIDPDCTDEFFTRIWQELKRHCFKTYERRHRASDGRIFPVEIRANYLVHEGREYVCFFATDISERKRKDKALRLTQFAIDKSPVQAFWRDPEGKFLYANEAACNSLGYSREELMGMSVYDIDPDVSKEFINALWQQIKECGTACFESRHKAKDGRVYPVEIRANLIQFEGVEYSCSFVTDISDQKQKEEALSRSEQRYRNLFENAPVGIFSSTLDGKFLRVNSPLARMMKFESPEEMIQVVNRTNIAEALYDNPSRRREILEKVLAHDGWQICEERFRCKDGSPFICNFYLRAVRKDDGDIELEGFAENITERWQAEQALKFTQFAIDNSIDQAYWMGEDARLLYVNDAACRALGYSREELLQMSIPDIGPTFPAEVYAEHWRRLKEEGALTFESWHQAKDGRVYPVEIRANYVVFDGREYVCAFATDISERRRSEEKLRSTNDLLRATIEAAPTAIIGLDLDGTVRHVWNPAAEKMLGWTADEAMGRLLPSVPQESQEEFSSFREWVRSGQPLDGVEVHRQRKDGTPIDYRIYASPLKDAAGGIIGNIAVLLDITEQRRAEWALHLTQFAIDKSHDMAFWMGENSRLIYANDAACRSLGYSREELLQMSIPDIGPTFPAEVFVEHWQELKKKGSLTFESFHRTKDGRIYPIEVRANYLVYDGQEYNCAFVTDISERKEKEQALRLSQFVVDHTVDQAFLMTPDAQILYANNAACASLGYSRDELVGLSVADIDPDMSVEQLIESWESLKTEKIRRFESRHKAKDGRIYPVEIRSNYVNFDGREYRFAFVTDISERKAADQALRQASLIVENSPVVLFRWRAAEGWPVDMVSDNVNRFGYTAEEMLSGAVPFADLVHPEDLQRVASEVEEYTRRGVDRFQQEYRIVTRQGDVCWIDDRTFLERDAEGRVTHYQGIVMDITDRKRTERVITARMRLLQFATTHSLDELLEATLNEVEALTESRIGFYHFLEADQQTLSLQSWSTRTKQEFCKAQGKGLHYSVSEAGVWVDCIHQRQPVIHDDYATLSHRKGLPEGHAPVVRELVVPVFRGDRIVAILGVGNKPRSYTPQDVEMVSLLADLAWTIVETKRAEEALMISERKYRDIIEHAPFGITRSTRDGKLVSVNPALASILKYDSAEELMETINRSSIQEVLFPKPSERTPLVEKILSHDSWTVFNNHLRCKDGSLVTCRVHSRRILDQEGQINEFESYQENISEQLAAEQALRESEEKFRVLAETSPVAICIFQGERYIYVNPAMERLFGYSAEDWGRMRFWDWAHEDCREQIQRRGMARLAGEPVPDQFEAEYLTKSGEEGYVLISAGMMEYQGRPTGVASFLDITERKRTEELVRASLEEKEVLLREIHHRVKNNLQVVSSLLFLQSQKFEDADLRTCFLESQSRICSMALAHEQLYQSKNLAKVSVQGYIENLVGQLQQIFSRPGQKVDCRLAVEDIELDIEKVIPCGLLITELLSNAYKHAFGDGRSGQVTISLKSSVGQIELAVADDGVGLPEGLDYRRVKTLGLQLVTALVNQLNGTLDHDRSNGTRFRVRFAASRLSQRS